MCWLNSNSQFWFQIHFPPFFQEILVAANDKAVKEVEKEDEACEEEPTEENLKELVGPKKSATQKKID